MSREPKEICNSISCNGAKVRTVASDTPGLGPVVLMGGQPGEVRCTVCGSIIRRAAGIPTASGLLFDNSVK